MKNVQSHPWVIGLLVGYFLLISSILVVTCVSCAHVDVHAARPVESRHTSTVLLEVSCITEDPWIPGRRSAPPVTYAYGSGVILDSSHVLTALHVVHCDFAADIRVITDTGKQFRMTLDREWPDRDVARLTGGEFVEHAPFIGQLMENTAVCSAVAWPLRGAHCGQVEHVIPPRCQQGYDAVNWCFDSGITMTAVGGNSGGPIYNELGELVGLVTGGSNDGTYALAISLGAIRQEVQ